jgi:hypothetical protein
MIYKPSVSNVSYQNKPPLDHVFALDGELQWIYSLSGRMNSGLRNLCSKSEQKQALLIENGILADEKQEELQK